MPADPCRGAPGGVQARHRAARAQHAGGGVDQGPALGVEERAGDLDRGPARRQRRLPARATELVDLLPAGHGPGCGDGASQAADRQPGQRGQVLKVVGPAHRAGGDQVLVVLERPAGSVDPLVDQHPGRRPGLADHRAGVLGVAGGLVPEPLGVTVDDDAAVHDGGPGRDDSVRDSHGAVSLIGVEEAHVGAQAPGDAQRVTGAPVAAEVERSGDLGKVPTDQLRVGAVPAGGEYDGRRLYPCRCPCGSSTTTPRTARSVPVTTSTNRAGTTRSTFGCRSSTASSARSRLERAGRASSGTWADYAPDR